MGSFRIPFYLRFLLLSILVSSGCFGQSLPPTLTYTLHAQKEPHPWSLGEIPLPPSTVLTATADGALLILMPQPERKWLLKEITGWYTQTPKEQSLAILSSSVRRDVDVWITGDLNVTRDGRYALVRITTRRRSSKLNVPDTEASITIVDLHIFAAVNSRVTTDPLIAGAQWFLTGDDVLISNALTKRTRANERSTSPVTDSFQAAILELPELKASNTCNYTKVLEFHGGSGWETKEEKTANLKCAGLLKAAKVATVNNLPGEKSVATFAREIHVPMSCNITDVSDDRRFALYDCSEGHQAWDTEITTSRLLLVLSMESSTSALSVSLKPEQPTVATLATAESKPYLIVLREGIKLEVYRVPELLN